MLTLYNGRPEITAGRSEKEIRTYDLLDSLGIDYERVDHPAAQTMADCVEIDHALAPAVICKNLFLCNKQETRFYLLALREDKKFITRKVSAQIGSTRLQFAPPEKMEGLLGLTPGSVSIMGLMNDKENKVQLLVDQDVLFSEYFACHPCINTSSIRMKTEDIFNNFLIHIRHDYAIVNI